MGASPNTRDLTPLVKGLSRRLGWKGGLGTVTLGGVVVWIANLEGCRQGLGWGLNHKLIVLPLITSLAVVFLLVGSAGLGLMTRAVIIASCLLALGAVSTGCVIGVMHSAHSKVAAKSIQMVSISPPQLSGGLPASHSETQSSTAPKDTQPDSTPVATAQATDEQKSTKQQDGSTVTSVRKNTKVVDRERVKTKYSATGKVAQVERARERTTTTETMTTSTTATQPLGSNVDPDGESGGSDQPASGKPPASALGGSSPATDSLGPGRLPPADTPSTSQVEQRPKGPQLEANVGSNGGPPSGTPATSSPSTSGSPASGTSADSSPAAKRPSATSRTIGAGR